MNQININETLLKAITDREREIIADMAEGLTCRQTARRRGITVRTVEVHRARLMERLGVHTLAETIRIGVLATLR